jgi:hypothetical protein
LIVFASLGEARDGLLHDFWSLFVRLWLLLLDGSDVVLLIENQSANFKKSYLVLTYWVGDNLASDGEGW